MSFFYHFQTLKKNEIKKLEKSIVKTICRLKKIHSPSYEAEVGKFV